MPECKTKKEKDMFVNVSGQLLDVGENDIFRLTGCKPNCKRTEYTTETLVKAPADMADKPNGSLYFQVEFLTASKTPVYK